MVFSPNWNTLWNECLPSGSETMPPLFTHPLFTPHWFVYWATLECLICFEHSGRDWPLWTRSQELPWEIVGTQSLCPQHRSRTWWDLGPNHVSGVSLHWLLFRWASEKKKGKKIRKGLMSDFTRCGSQKHPFDGIWETYFFKQSTFKSDLKSPAVRLGPVCIPFIHRLLAGLPINSILRAAPTFSGDNTETSPL